LRRQLLPQAIGPFELFIARAANRQIGPGVAIGAGERLRELVGGYRMAVVNDLVAFDTRVIISS
jgi:hypothetical protein